MQYIDWSVPLSIRNVLHAMLNARHIIWNVQPITRNVQQMPTPQLGGVICSPPTRGRQIRISNGAALATDQHSQCVCIVQQNIWNVHHIMWNVQHITLNVQHMICNVHHIAWNLQHILWHG